MNSTEQVLSINDLYELLNLSKTCAFIIDQKRDKILLTTEMQTLLFTSMNECEGRKWMRFFQDSDHSKLENGLNLLETSKKQALHARLSQDHSWKHCQFYRLSEYHIVLILTPSDIQANLYHKYDAQINHISVHENLIEGSRISYSPHEMTTIESDHQIIKQRFKSFLEHLPVGYTLTSDNLDILYANPALEQMLNKDQRDLDRGLIMNYIYPADREKVLKAFQEMKNRKVIIEYRLQLPDSPLKWIRTRGFPDKYLNGNVIVGIHEDITEFKEKEVIMARSKKLETVAQLAAGIAHEIRNPLTSIQGFVQLMFVGEGLETKYSQIIKSELSRIDEIVNEFMMLAKPESDRQMVKTNIIEIVEYVISLFHNQFNEKEIDIDYQIEKEISVVQSDPKRLKQIFINLIKNAIEAVEVKGEIRIRISCEKDQSYLNISIKDNGKGIKPEQVKRIGEPFFTTKEKGTGLGLMVTKKLIDHLGGFFHIESVDGQGTTVFLELPLSE